LVRQSEILHRRSQRSRKRARPQPSLRPTLCLSFPSFSEISGSFQLLATAGASVPQGQGALERAPDFRIEGNKDCVALEPERRRSVPLCAPPHNRGKPRQFTYIATRYPVSGPKSRRIFTFRWSEAEPQTARMRPSTETAADASRLMSVPKKRSAAPLELFPMVLVSGVPVTPELQLRLPPGCL
jgi:hypothetical protein